MNSKLQELRAMLRKEIKAVLQEADSDEIKSPEQKAAEQKLLKAKEEKLKADQKALQAQKKIS